MSGLKTGMDEAVQSQKEWVPNISHYSNGDFFPTTLETLPPLIVSKIVFPGPFLWQIAAATILWPNVGTTKRPSEC
jgi:hypothetical protein